MYFWKRGYEMELATNGLQCLATVRASRPDVVVLESRLLWGGADGLLAVMRDQPATRHIPVILVGDAPNDVDHASFSPVDGFLHKPFRLGDLLCAIELTRKSRRSSPEPVPACFHT